MARERVRGELLAEAGGAVVVTEVDVFGAALLAGPRGHGRRSGHWRPWLSSTRLIPVTGSPTPGVSRAPCPRRARCGGAELGELVQLYKPAGTWPAPADAPAAAPPVVASGPGSRVGWLLRGRRGHAEGDPE